MLLKVCGFNDALSYSACLENEQVDFLGSIFYSKSKRYTKASFVKSSHKNVAVFVDETEGEIRKIASKHGFQNIQLHGNETVELCLNLKKDFTVFKAFGIDSSFDFTKLNEYEQAVDYFLFDTKTENHGGSGIKFDWNMLSSYASKTPFFLSGGLKSEDSEYILQWKHPLCVGIDINSGFELEPGVKNVAEIQAFIQKIKKQKL
jgi:phosphoribosylanthranilate isomerase